MMDNPKTYSGVPTIDQNESVYKPPTATIPQTAQVEVDDSKASADYVNFCRLSGLPEELLIDFGFNLQSTGLATPQVAVTQRVVTGWYTAKRLFHVLQLTVERHEAAFGVLETNVQKRMQSP